MFKLGFKLIPAGLMTGQCRSSLHEGTASGGNGWQTLSFRRVILHMLSTVLKANFFEVMLQYNYQVDPENPQDGWTKAAGIQMQCLSQIICSEEQGSKC